MGTLGVVVIIASVVIATSAIVYFELPRTGQYQGPGLPISKSYSFTLDGNGSYAAVPVEINASVGQTFWFNVSGQAYANNIVSGVMNQTEYNNLTNNSGLNWLKEVEYGSGQYYQYEGIGPQTLYAVELNTNNFTASIDITIQVTVLE